MAEIKNYTLNFSFGRSLCDLNFACAKLACSEVQRELLVVGSGCRG
jgi:hypothetical protein